MKKIKNFIKHIFIVYLTIITTLFSTGNAVKVKATNFTETRMYDVGGYNAKLPGNYAWSNSWNLKHVIDGIIALCLEMTNPASGTYSKVNYNDLNIRTYDVNGRLLKEIPLTEEKVKLLTLYGFIGIVKSNKTNVDIAATQLLAWEVENDADFGYGDNPLGSWHAYAYQGGYSEPTDEVKQRFAEIKEEARKLQIAPSFNGETITLKLNQPVTLTDTNHVIEKFMATKGYDFTHEGIRYQSANGNQLIVTLVDASTNATASPSIRNVSTEDIISSDEVKLFKSSNGGQSLFAPSGFMDPEKFVIFFNVVKSADIEILKVDEKGNVVPGVVFEQSTTPDFSSDVWELTTGENGIGKDTWNRGDIMVYVREKTVPAHLVKSNEVKQVQLIAGQATKVQFTNQIKKGKIALSKQMDKNINGRVQDGLKVAGANIEFDIVDKTGKIVETITTNENGYAESGLINYGVYTVKEKPSSENEGYKLVKDFKVEIKEHNKVYHYALENFIKQSKLKIVKTDAETKQTVALAGFEFKLKDAQGNFVKQVVSYPVEKEIDVFTTDETGTVQLPENLVFGKYKIVELNTPKDSGYVLNDVELEVDIKGDETVVTVEFENQRQKLVVELEKFAEQLTKFETEKQVISGKEYEVTVPKFEEKYLAGVTFELREKNGTMLQRKTTTADAKLVFDPVDLGKYDLVEVETVTGYVLNSKPIEVVGTAQEQTIQFDIQSQKVKNDKQTYKVNFKKVLENSEHFKKEKAEAYKEVVFGLYTKQDLNINGVQIAKDTLVGVTGLNEKFEGNFDLMFAGEFYVKELATNQSYVLNEENTEVKVEASTDKKEIVTKVEKPIENKLKRVSIQLIKVDRLDHNKTLEGAEFKLIAITDAGEKELDTYTTDKNGKIEVKQLETGKYRFIETKAPKGYFNSNEKIDLNIDSTVQNNDLIKVQVGNDKIFKVHINKIDALTKEALIDKEVEFTLYDKDMNVLEVKTVDLSTGIATFDVKAQTQYYIKETKAPLGYILSEEVVSVNLKGDEKDASYTILFENEPVQEEYKPIVETSDTNQNIAYGFAMIISLVGLYLLRKNKQQG